MEDAPANENSGNQQELASIPAGVWSRLALVAILAVLFVSAFWLLPLPEYFRQLLAWLESHGRWGPVLLAAIYVAACSVALPVWPLTMGAGFLFGLSVGFIVVMTGDTLGAVAAFLISRGFARRMIEARLMRHSKYAAIDRAISHEGFKIVFLLRLSPAVPYNVLNYVLGLTGISLSRYASASFLGMMPGALLYVYLGTAVKSLADLYSGQVQHGKFYYTMLVLGLAATLAVTVLLARTATRAVGAATQSAAEPRSSAALAGDSKPFPL